MGRRKINYRGLKEVEKELYRIAKAVESKEMSASAANVIIHALKLWLKTRETRQLEEFEKRLSALEAQKKTEDGGHHDG